MKYLIWVNHAPYGGERSYNALRLAIDAPGVAGTELLDSAFRRAIDGLMAWTQ